VSEKYKCGGCGSEDVEILLPAWFNPNDLYIDFEADDAAEELAVWCNECEEADHLIAPNGQTVTGRWQ
jgi:hypothetical protein